MAEEITEEKTFKRHWSFVVCDKRYLYPFAALIFLAGIVAAIILKDANQINRVGSFIIGIGVWMSMRFTLREGINKNKNALDSSPVITGAGRAQQLNANYFNNITFSIGDAQLQLHGFFLVILGSVFGSYGDLIISLLLPDYF
jgi:hypothetical protein